MSESLNRIDRVRQAVEGVTVEGITDTRMTEILSGGRLPTSLEYALIAEASGRTVDWLLHGRERFFPPVHYVRDDGVDCCVHTISVGPDSCRACRELADEEDG